jgi:hypothetical protein
VSAVGGRLHYRPRIHRQGHILHYRHRSFDYVRTARSRPDGVALNVTVDVNGIILIILCLGGWGNAHQACQHQGGDEQHLAAVEATGGCANADSERSDEDCEKPVPPEQKSNHG